MLLVFCYEARCAERTDAVSAAENLRDKPHLPLAIITKQHEGQLQTCAASGGAIIVKKTGDIVCFYIVRKQSLQDFREYLYQNAYFETASTTRHKFGNFYEEDNKKFIKLNLQIRLRYKK